MNSQIQLTTIRINAAQQKIDTLLNEIDQLETEVQRLEGVLDERLALLLHRIPESYKRSVVPQFGMLLLSNNFGDFLTRAKYLQFVQQEDAALVFQVKATQNSYNESKQMREDKKQQLQQIQQELEQQNTQLAQQKQQKNELLAVTQGNEQTYNELLVIAKAQLAAFSGFVQGLGGLTLIPADPNWPSNYFSQRDLRWGNVTIGGFYSSPSYMTTIGESGCLISSVAMVLSKRGTSTTPLVVGTNGSNFVNAYFIWNSLNALGFNTPMRTLDRSVIDNSLSQGKWVIVGLTYSASTGENPFHFVVITSKQGSDYNLFDPWRGPNISLNSNYGSDYITEVITY